MSQYPLTFPYEFQHVAHIYQNEEWYTSILRNSQLRGLHQQSQISMAPVFQGELDETRMRTILENICLELEGHWFLDVNKKNKAMDLRMQRGEQIVGIECKDKLTITSHDIEKFRRDKFQNKFIRSVFVSRKAAIPKFVNELNKIHMEEDEIYIYSNDDKFIFLTIMLIMKQIKPQDDQMSLDSLKKMIIMFTHTYQQWHRLKSELKKLDECFLNMMELTGNDKPPRHLYLVPQSQIQSRG